MKNVVKYSDVYEDVEILKSFGNDKFYNGPYQDGVLSNKGIKKHLKNLLNVFEDITAKFDKKHSVLFYPYNRFEWVVEILSKRYNVLSITYGLYNEWNKRVKFFFPNQIEEKLYFGWIKHDMSYTFEAFDMIRQLVEKNNIKLFILGNDRLFIERALCIVARQMGIKVAIIQHGIYISADLCKNKIGFYADEFWTWSAEIAEKYNEMTEGKYALAKVLGYPYDTNNVLKLNAHNKALFIGEYYEKLNEKKAKKFSRIVKQICNACNDLNIDFYYRPHPAEDINAVKAKYGGLEGFHISKNKVLKEDILTSRLIIGDISSVLLEAGLYNRRVIQIIWDEDSRRISQMPIYENTIKLDLNHENDLNNSINSILREPIPPFDSYYLFNNANIREVLYEYVDAIIKK